MNRNIRIAKELVRIAKELTAVRIEQRFDFEEEYAAFTDFHNRRPDLHIKPDYYEWKGYMRCHVWGTDSTTCPGDYIITGQCTANPGAVMDEDGIVPSQTVFKVKKNGELLPETFFTAKEVIDAVEEDIEIESGSII